MSEDTTNDAPQDEAPNTGQDAKPNTNDVAEDAGGEDDKLLTFRESQKIKGEAASLRERLRLAEEKVKAADDAKLSEQEKLQRQVQELTDKIGKRDATTRNLLLMSAVEELKPSLGIRSPRAIAKLIDADALTFDLDGMTVEGVEAQIKQLKKEDPDLFISGGTDGGAGGNGRAASPFDMNTRIRRAAGR